LTVKVPQANPYKRRVVSGTFHRREASLEEGRIMSGQGRPRSLGPSIIFATVVFVCVSVPMMAKRNDDVVIMKNGDRITCEIKRLENGVLYVYPPYVLAEYGVDWAQVERVESKDTYTVALTSGERYTGTIERTPAKGEATANFKISRNGSPVAVKSNEVAVVRPVEEGFWQQQTGSINAGFNFTQGNSSAQLSVSGNTDYRQEKYSLHLEGSATFSSQAKTQTARYTTNFYYNRFFRVPWYTGTILNLLKSDQQKLRLRASLGEGIGRDLVRTNRTFLSAIGGAMFTTEWYFPGPGLQPRDQNAEAVAGLTFSTYRFSTTEVTSETYVYPSLSTPGRVRVSTSSNLMFQVARNLKWYFTVYENFDSQPPINAPRNDAGVSTSVGWTF